MRDKGGMISKLCYLQPFQKVLKSSGAISTSPHSAQLLSLILTHEALQNEADKIPIQI